MAPLSLESIALLSSSQVNDNNNNKGIVGNTFDHGVQLKDMMSLEFKPGVNSFVPSSLRSMNPLSVNASTTTSTTGANNSNGPNNGPNSPGSATTERGGGGSGGGSGSGGGGHGSSGLSTGSHNQSNGSNNGHGLSSLDNESYGIRDVWAANLEDEFKIIRAIVQSYPYVAMDTEFPGVVARPIGEFKSTCDYQYHLLKVNVDLLKIIQLGLTFLDDRGKPRPGISTWQFNFKFNLQEDMYAQDSIELLQNSGIQFKKHEEDGIDVFEFAELLMTSGVVLNDNVKYLSFHSGYDFGYLLKILTDEDLPADESEFFELLRIYFPVIYDVKYLMKSCKDLKGGLQEVCLCLSCLHLTLNPNTLFFTGR